MHPGALTLLLLANPYQALIDQHAGVPEIVGDAAFLRRASLDARGRPPSVDEVRAVKSRIEVIERWLKEDDAARYWAALWTDVLIQRTGKRVNRTLFASWLADEWRKETPWSSVVTQMLTATGDLRSNGPATFLGNFPSFEEATGETARLFLGSSLQCAQCHDHPDQDYSVRDFHGLMAFLVRTRGRGAVMIDVEFGHARMPDGGVVYPRWRGRSFDCVSGGERRAELANIVISDPDFARATVNRIWAGYLGRGLVENIDDVRDLQPEDEAGRKLLDALADRFARDGYRVGPLVAGILGSRAYQAARPGPIAFRARALNPQQLEASLSSITGMAQSLDARGSEPTIPRALALMNERTLQLGLRARAGDGATLDRLFLAALSRLPTPEERAAFSGDSEDVLWALINSAEFSSHF